MPLTIGGGKAIIYGSSIIADMRKLSISDADTIKKEDGVKIGFTVRKNHVITDRYPYVKTEYYGLFGKGTELYLELIELAIENGLLVKSGAFIKIPDENGDPLIVDGEKMQWQGTAKFRQYCIDHEDFFNDLKNKVINSDAGFEKLSDEEIQEIQKDEESIEEAIKNETYLEEDLIKKSKKK